MRGLLLDPRAHLSGAVLAGVFTVGMASEAERGDPAGHGDPSCCEWCAQLASGPPAAAGKVFGAGLDRPRSGRDEAVGRDSGAITR